MRRCGSSTVLESSGLLASPSSLSAPTPPATTSAAAPATVDPTRTQTGSLAPSPFKSGRASSLPQTPTASAAHTARRVRPRAPGLVEISLLRSDTSHSPVNAFAGRPHYYNSTAAASRSNNNTNNNTTTTNNNNDQPTASPLIGHSNPPHSPRASRPGRRSSDCPSSAGVEEIRSAFRRQTVDVGTQYSRPATPAKNTLIQSASAATGETTFADSTNVTSELAASQQSQESLQSQADSQMPSTLVGSKRNTPDTSSLLPTDGDNPLSIDPDSPAESLSKRLRPEKPAAKVLPRRYEEADPRDLVFLISSMLMELIRFNDQIPLRDGRLTRFHSRSPPRISVHDYLQRLTTHATLSPPILLSMVYYIDRLCALYPAFTVSSLTVHRFLISSATVASKGLSDSFWTNKTYARVGGISVAELALLELEFLWRVEWRIVPQPEVLVDYYQRLVERCDEYVIQPEGPIDIQSTSTNETPASSTSIARNGGEDAATTDTTPKTE
ncbi:hypothetical protein GX51_03675 [Blastomyces parvus]|uniref:Phosphate system cyclin PHO80 n=1 Tax=Blastomyces parvus TaxID=2060905 RepID=A0A2B7X676_9EURO|nr:hypothetical protein GX51_03675 [Blastomyces parvus]